MKRPTLVILDRDGVINRDSANYVRSAAEWHALPGAFAAIAKLSMAGIRVAVATNQSGIARGYFTRRQLYAMHAKLRRGVRAAGGEIALIRYCPDGPDDNSRCRKPEPGMFEDILARLDVAPGDALAIGDSGRDLVAAERAGVRAWLVLTGNGTKTQTEAAFADVPAYTDLATAVDALLSKTPPTL